MKAAFYGDNEDIKSATRELIDTSFRKLRSAEGACELLQSFKSIKSVPLLTSIPPELPPRSPPDPPSLPTLGASKV